MKKVFLILTTATVAIAAGFYPSKGVEKIATLTESKHDISFSVDGSYNVTMDGKGITTLTINNNEQEGYDIYATATNGALVTPTQKQQIEYTLTCKAFLTDNGGFTVPEVSNIKLMPGVETLIYHIESPANTTIMAETTCDIVPDAGQNFKGLLDGSYTDNIVFSML